MADPTHSPEDGAVSPQQAYVSLLARSGHFGGVDPSLPGFRPLPTSEALRALTDAPKDEVPHSVRIAILFELAGQHFPDREFELDEYRRLADSVTAGTGVDPDELLKDLEDAATRHVAFRETRSGQALPPEEVAFVGESVCDVRRVKVGDLAGAWIYSEFETDAPFDSVSDWVDPRNWPELARFMFKRMDVVGARQPLAISGQGDEHWHGVFHEEVQLFERVSALLHCVHWEDGDRAAGMTFELTFSPDGQLDVDRGFILVNNTGLETGGQGCRVQALKIVGFTEDRWDELAQFVCPYWTDFLRGAVKGSSLPPRPTTPTSPGSPPATPSSEDVIEAWTQFFGASARTYLDLFEDITTRATTSRYSASAWMADGSRFWSQLAKDWVQAWSYALDTLPEMARDADGPGLIPHPPVREGAPTALRGLGPAAPRPLDGLVIPVPGLAEADRPVSSALVSIEGARSTIAARDVSVTVLEPADGTNRVLVRTSDASAPPGLYVGELLRTAGGPTLVPVQFYVSGATGA